MIMSRPFKRDAVMVVIVRPRGIDSALDPAFTSSRAGPPSGKINRAIPARSATVISTRTPFASVTA